MARLCFHHHPLGVDDPEFPDGAGAFADRPTPLHRNYATRAFTVGIGGPVGSGKTALLLALCRALRDRHNLAVVTNDIFTKEDAEFLVRNQALPAERIAAVETGGCPHTAVRDDISQNLEALHRLMREFHPELLFVESGGDNLAAQFSRDLVDYTIYVIDVSGGDKIPRKGGPGITQSDLLVINKTDLAPLVRADLGVMERDARKMRGDGPFLFAQVTRGVGVAEIIEHLVGALTAATEARGREGAEPRRDREGTKRGGGPPRATEPGSGAEPRCGREGAERGGGPPRATEPGSGAEPRF